MQRSPSKAGAGDANPPAELYARAACMADEEGFVAIARACVEDAGVAFNEQAVRYLFGGLPRADPLVNLLMAGDEIVGFALMFITSTFLTNERLIREEQVFIRPEHRSAEAELLLHSLAHEAFDKMRPAEGYLTIPPTPHALEVRANMEAVGYCIASVRMRYGSPGEGDAAAQAERAKTIGGGGAKSVMH